MKRSQIRIIISVATALLIALVVTQVFWVQKAYKLEQKQFAYNVTQSLLRTLTNLQKAEGDSSIILDPIVQKKLNFFVVKTHYLSDPYLLESLLEMELKQASIHEEFIFNIYDCFTDSVVHCKHVNLESPNASKNEIPIVNWDKDQGHYFSIYFPSSSTNMFYQMEFWVYSSIILIIVIAFFAFIILQMVKQRRINEMKTDFINNMTHEFKTPISTISISVDALQKQRVLESPEKIMRYAQIIETENLRLQNQVERILQAATIEKENVTIKKTAINLHQILEDVINTFHINVSAKNGTISTRFNAQNSLILGDAVHLTNIFSNLIDNAIKYSDKKLEIQVTTTNVNDKVVVEVKDYGIGISAEHLPKIFDKFYRVPTGDIHDVKGFGIGLNYVRILTEKHQGTISVKSNAQNGTVFRLTFKTVKN